ncbi:MAG: hypothetical protein JO042_03065, partial [Sinobacteraceae bacterium]|nr:hypothetical protein [Nevskiaceae bacterium]
MMRIICLLLVLMGIGSQVVANDTTPPNTPVPKYPEFPSETPPTFQPSTEGFDYERREVMIAMRDGIKLHTVILLPKGTH